MERQFLQFASLEIKGLFHAVSLRQADDSLCVEENQRRILEDLGIQKVAKLHQVHGMQVIYAGQPGLSQGDALITKEKGLALVVRHADCQAAIFYDPEKEQIACVHAGWRGLVANIYAEVVKSLNTNPKGLFVAIAPSLGPRHAYYPEFPLEFKPFMENPHYYNFWDLAEKQLQDLGVQNIHIERVCTYEHPESFYSYRRDKTTGRHATLVRLE